MTNTYYCDIWVQCSCSVWDSLGKTSFLKPAVFNLQEGTYVHVVTETQVRALSDTYFSLCYFVTTVGCRVIMEDFYFT